MYKMNLLIRDMLQYSRKKRNLLSKIITNNVLKNDSQFNIFEYANQRKWHWTIIEYKNVQKWMRCFSMGINTRIVFRLTKIQLKILMVYTCKFVSAGSCLILFVDLELYTMLWFSKIMVIRSIAKNGIDQTI